MRRATAWVIAMNGVGSGTSTSARPAREQASTTPRGIRLYRTPTPNPRPAAPASVSRST
jgi:hypothetical protein